jgi:two-component system OmpR family sensor kinase
MGPPAVLLAGASAWLLAGAALRPVERGFVADAGHELQTPLAILHAELEPAARPGRSREELAEAVGHAGEKTDRLIRWAETCCRCPR